MTITIQINQKRITIQTLPLDTDSTVLDRIAMTVNSLPRYIIWNKESNQVVNVLEMASTTPNAIDFMNTYKDSIEPSVLYTLWSIKNPRRVELYEAMVSRQFPSVTVRNTRLTETSLNTEMNRFRKDQQTRLKRVIDFDTIPPSSRFITREEITPGAVIQQYIEIRDTPTLPVLFNNMNPSEAIPIITFNNLYKVLKYSSTEFSFPSTPDSISAYNGGDVVITIWFIEEGVFKVEYVKDSIDLSALFSYRVTGESETGSNGIITLNHSLDPTIIGDILFKPQFMDLLALNDLTVLKSGIAYSHTLYLDHPYDTTTKSAIKMAFGISKSNTTYPINTPVTSFSLTNTTPRIIRMVRYILDRVLYIYQMEYTSILKQYIEFNAIDRPATPSIHSKRVFMKDIDPLVFSSQYTRRCQPKEKIPRILQEDEEADPVQRVLTFPKEDMKTDEGIILSRRYVCDDPVFKYPGIIKDGNDIGYSPCCFKNDPVTKKNYRDYYNCDDSKEKSCKITYIKRTDKPLADNEIGFIPSKYTLYRKLFTDSSRTVARKGVPPSPDTLLVCIRNVLGLEESVQDMKNYIAQSSHLLRQEMYDYTPSGIRDYVLSDSFKDYRLLAGCFTVLFGCHVLVLAGDDFVFPRYHPNTGYMRFVRDSSLPTVVLYESGHEVLEYPTYTILHYVRNELVPTLSEVNPVWDFETIWDLYDERFRFYSKYELPAITPLENVTGQWFDSFGKVVKVVIGQDMVFDTTPMPAYNVPVYRLRKPLQFDKEKAQAYAKTVANPTVRLTPTDYNFSVTKQYHFYSRVARVMKGWILYLYALNPMDDLQEFIRQNTVVIEGHTYEGGLHYSFDMEKCPSIIRGGKLICDSFDTADRISYHLQWSLSRTPDLLSRYSSATVNPNFFKTEHDYDVAPDSLIFYYNRDTAVVPMGSMLNHTQKQVSTDPVLGEMVLYKASDRIILTKPQKTVEQAIKVAYEHFGMSYTEQPPVYLYFGSFNTPYRVGDGEPKVAIYAENNVWYPILA